MPQPAVCIVNLPCFCLLHELTLDCIDYASAYRLFLPFTCTDLGLLTMFLPALWTDLAPCHTGVSHM